MRLFTRVEEPSVATRHRVVARAFADALALAAALAVLSSGACAAKRRRAAAVRAQSVLLNGAAEGEPSRGRQLEVSGAPLPLEEEHHGGGDARSHSMETQVHSGTHTRQLKH